MLKKLFAINKKETGSYILGHVPGEQVFMLHFCEENRTVYLNENGARTVCDKPEEPDENESGDPCQIGDMITAFMRSPRMNSAKMRTADTDCSASKTQAGP